MLRLPFENRFEAGRLLGVELALHKDSFGPIVLGLARGGVAVAAGLAQSWQVPMDVLLVRKLGIPWQSEVAMGALAGETCILNQRLIDDLRISDVEVREAVERESREIKRREKLFRDNRPVPVVAGRDVVLVDDGLATGATMLAAVRHVRAGNPRRTMVAVPVASSEAFDELKREADACVCLARPQPFVAVGHWYIDFHQITDEEVRDLLRTTASATLAASRATS